MNDSHDKAGGRRDAGQPELATRLAALVVAAVDDRKGVDPVALDVSRLTELTDAMVIVTGSSSRHVKAIVDNVLLAAKRSGAEVLGTEGREHSDWVLIDLADVVVHVMSPEARRFYDLEGLWEQPERGSAPMFPTHAERLTETGR